jgi:Protein of unknown function (DUF2970)
MSGLKEAAARPASFLQTLRAVALSFFGVGKRAHLDQDAAKLNPVHLVIAGILGGALFVLTLVLLVRWVVGSGVASA